MAQSRIYGLVGPNGSGKSTLLKMLARQLSPTSGVIKLLGRRIVDFGDRDFARHVAYMPQFTPGADGMSVRELVGLGRFPWHGALGRFTAEDRAEVEQALEKTSLSAFADRLVDSLSGGERQRAWLAMMLAQKARCLLLDEPTSALDIAHQVEMLSLVREISRTQAIGVVVVLHDINMAVRYCDEIIALGGGRITAQGTPNRILSPGILEQIYGIPINVMPHPSGGAPISYVV